ncbi:MAG TPA: hypothetical protein VMH49_04410 [Thermoplasmata archaeon]|nr:hypothetical protein [Thermoplasmata archaeon]
MLLFSDLRGFATEEERFSRCVYCGRDLVLLPDDRRRGSCFDCLALSLAPASPCPSCGSPIPGEERALGCPECGWYPERG